MSHYSVEFEITDSSGNQPYRVWICDEPNAAPLGPGERAADIRLSCGCGSWVAARMTQVKREGEGHPCQREHDLVELRGGPSGVEQVAVACRRCGTTWKPEEPT